MPLPFVPLIAAGGSLLTTALQGLFNRKAYNQQKSDALDNWNRQNAFNSPSAQMDRFRTAGLNPNLIYGQSNSAGAIHLPKKEVTQAPNVVQDTMSSMSAYNLQGIQKQQLLNLQQQEEVMKQDALLKQANIASLMAKTDLAKFDLGFKNLMKDTQSAILTESLRKLQVGNLSTFQSIGINEKKLEVIAAQANQSILESAERIARMHIQNLLTQEQTANTVAERGRIKADIGRIYQSIENLKTDNRLKGLEEEMRNAGTSFSDAGWQRSLKVALDQSGITDALKGGAGMLRSFIKGGGAALESGYNSFKNMFQ